MAKTVLAMGCHPDDIEFLMAGTLLHLKDRGCDVHYMITASGDLGSLRYGREELARIRREEARAAAAFLGAHFHDSITGDLQVFYAEPLISRVAAVVREVRPDIMLVMSPQDYMEDHMNTCRIGVTAAFAKGVPNYVTDPPREAYQGDVTLYHALPHGLRDGLGTEIAADFFIDITAVIDRKQEMLALHKSQQDWLGASQGMNSYLATMRDMAAEVGSRCGSYQFAEGFRRHSHLGFSAVPMDPLGDILGDLRCEARKDTGKGR